MRDGEEEVQFTGRVERETEMAVLFKGRSWSTAQWFPKSKTAVVLRSEAEGYAKGESTLCVPMWLAEKKGLV